MAPRRSVQRRGKPLDIIAAPDAIGRATRYLKDGAG
jgi:hypothetical protein